MVRNRFPVRWSVCFVVLVLFNQRTTLGQVPTMDVVFPAGGQAGKTVDVTITGANSAGIRALQTNILGVRCELIAPGHFRLAIPAGTPPGQYDVWAVGEQGVSGLRTFSISQRNEQLEIEPNEDPTAGTSVLLDVIINGRLDKPGDIDCFRFEARRGQRVVVECAAERIDSRLRAVLELFDASGRRLAVNRGYFGIDPLIDFRVPVDGTYLVKIQDLISGGSAEHYYRLEIDTGPRVAFTVPNVVQRGKPAKIALFGWNLPATSMGDGNGDPTALDRVEVEIPETVTRLSAHLPVRLRPDQVVYDGFAYHFPGSHAVIAIGVTDLPVVLDRQDNHSPASAQEIAVPSEVSGQLVIGDECDWYAIQAQRGEVLYIEGFGQRIQSPVDLQCVIRNSVSNTPGAQLSGGEQDLIRFNDEVRNIGGVFPTNHLDPGGRWVCPSDGRYLVGIRNLIGGLQANPRRTYRLSIRREEPDVHLVVIPRQSDSSSLNVPSGGREILDLLAFRQRGFQGLIRVVAKDLPSGIECPDVWLGPGIDRTCLVVSVDRNAEAVCSELKLEAVIHETDADQNDFSTRGKGQEGNKSVRSGTIVRGGTPSGWGRLTSTTPLAITKEAPLRITAIGDSPLNHQLYGQLQVKHSPGGVLDVAVQIERRDSSHQAPIKLIGVGLPGSIRNETATIRPGEHAGYLSFYLPPTMPAGHYSLVIQAETTVSTLDKRMESVVVYSNPVTFHVQSAAFLVEVDPFAVTQVRRGEVVQVAYTAKRLNGFIGKMHTELAAPGRITDIVGLRGRGETFVGQSDKGTLQITVNEDAPLGRQSFLRLFTVGVVEDQPIYQGSSFLSLEVVE